MKKFTFLIFFLFSVHSGFSQYKPGVCASYDAFKQQMSIGSNKALVQKFLETTAQQVKNILANMATPELHSDNYTVPVIFHIVKNKSDVVFTQKEIQNVLDSLNNYFGEGGNYVRPPAKFNGSFMRQAYIRFAPAMRTPDNKPLAKPGMNEVDVPDVPLTYMQVKKKSTGGVDPWDESRFINIWVCDLTYPSGVLFGVGTFPDLANDGAQGVVINYILFKPSLIAPYCQQLRTFAHELGHFFGLRHIWGDDDNNDFVGDTPTPTIQHDNVCPTVDDNTMYMNYMDYSCDKCRYMFTKGQVARLLSTLSPGSPRASLLTSNALLPPSATERNFLNDIGLEGADNTRSSWQASLIMLFGWACQCTPDLDKYMAAIRASYKGLPGLPENISQTAQALALPNYRELLVSYSMADFYRLLSSGPIAVISVGSAGEPYGLVISGMRFDANGQGQLMISDPMSIGAKGFDFKFVSSTKEVSPRIGGSQYTVDYNKFMVDLMSNALANKKRIFLFSH